MQKISGETLVPLSLIAVLTGAIFLVATLFSNQKSNAEAIEKIETKQDKYTDIVQKIDTRLGRIEGKLGVRDE
jgi:hypothetical protein